MDYLLLFILIICAYLLGSLTPAVWFSKYYYGKDIRLSGSGNAGSTNMYRVYGFKAGFLTQLIDISKGTIAALLPFFFQSFLWIDKPDYHELQNTQLLMGVSAIIGHVYTVFANFKGGKGVNTILGIMLGIHPLGAAVGITIFIIVLLIGKMVSLASMIAVFSFPLLLITLSIINQEPINTVLLIIAFVLFVYIVYTHRSNIQRIRNGTENKVGFLSRKNNNN